MDGPSFLDMYVSYTVYPVLEFSVHFDGRFMLRNLHDDCNDDPMLKRE